MPALVAGIHVCCLHVGAQCEGPTCRRRGRRAQACRKTLRLRSADSGTLELPEPFRWAPHFAPMHTLRLLTRRAGTGLPSHRPNEMLGGGMGTDIIIPDFEWYSTQGPKRASGTPRCPFASTERCPRYHHSRSLLGEAGFTRMHASEDAPTRPTLAAIGAHASDCRTVDDRHIVGRQNSRGYWNFCPEVSYNSFRVFRIGLASLCGRNR